MTRLVLPFQRAYDLNGKPLDGAKLHFDVSGTSTPKDTFSDIGLSVPNTNPVIADSQGQFGEIFLNGTYRVTLTDKDDVVQPDYPADDVNTIQGLNLSGALNTARATVASHATTSAIWAAPANEIDFTGNETLTDLPAAPQPGASRILIAAGTPTFTDNATLDVQGGTYTCASGDRIIIDAITTVTFKVTIQKADGTSTGTLAIANGGTGQTTAATAFNALKQAATETATGVVELATDAETVTGTATNIVTTPANITAKMSAPGPIGDVTPATSLGVSGATTLGDDVTVTKAGTTTFRLTNSAGADFRVQLGGNATMGTLNAANFSILTNNTLAAVWDTLQNFTLSGLFRRKTTAGITADVGSSQGDGPLTSDINQISVCANIGDAVTLPTAVAGSSITITNNGANACDVFPASGDNLGAGVDTAASLAAGAKITYDAYDATNWT